MLTMFLENPSKLDLKTEEDARTADKTAEERIHIENESGEIPRIFSRFSLYDEMEKRHVRIFILYRRRLWMAPLRSPRSSENCREI